MRQLTPLGSKNPESMRRPAVLLDAVQDGFTGKLAFVSATEHTRYGLRAADSDTRWFIGAIPVADSWKIAAWFHFPNGWIAGTGDLEGQPAAPRDSLDRHDAVVEAAARHADHGYVA